MTDLTTLISMVTASTGRSDVDGLITDKVNQAIRSMALSDTYDQDVVEVSFTKAAAEIDDTIYVQTLAIPSRFRKIAYLVYPEVVSIEPIIPTSLMELKKATKRQILDVCYRSGSSIHVRNATLTETLLLGYYEYPIALVAGGNSNWITELVPGLVADIASIYIHSHIGDKLQANAINRITREGIKIAMHDAIASYEHGVLDK